MTAASRIGWRSTNQAKNRERVRGQNGFIKIEDSRLRQLETFASADHELLGYC